MYDPPARLASDWAETDGALNEAAAMAEYEGGSIGDAAGATGGPNCVHRSSWSDAAASLDRDDDFREDTVDEGLAGNASQSLPLHTSPLRGFGRGTPNNASHHASGGSAGSGGRGRGSQHHHAAVQPPYESPRRLRSHAPSVPEQGPGLSRSWREFFAAGGNDTPRTSGRGHGRTLHGAAKDSGGKAGGGGGARNKTTVR